MGRPSNLSRMIVERVLRAAAETEVTRHDNLTKLDFSPVASPTAGATRMRRYRERRKRASVLVEFEVVGTALEDLVALSWLDAGERGSRDAVAAAIVALAARALALRVRPTG